MGGKIFIVWRKLYCSLNGEAAETRCGEPFARLLPPSGIRTPVLAEGIPFWTRSTGIVGSASSSGIPKVIVKLVAFRTRRSSNF